MLWKAILLGLVILYVTVAANYIRFNENVQDWLIKTPVISYALLFVMSYLIIENVGERPWFYNALGALTVVLIFSLTTHFRLRP